MKIVIRKYGDIELSRGPNWDRVGLAGWLVLAVLLGWLAARQYYWAIWMN